MEINNFGFGGEEGRAQGNGKEAEGDNRNRKTVVKFIEGGQFSKRTSVRSAQYWHWK